ncbi:hypothetical protein BH20VER1_BH20VER1_30990 [soil metagenome]
MRTAGITFQIAVVAGAILLGVLLDRLLLVSIAPFRNGAQHAVVSEAASAYVAEDVFQQFAATDFENAVDRAKGIPGDELRYRALRGILGFKADSDPQGALQLAETFGSDLRGQEPLTSVVYRQWASTQQRPHPHPPAD